MHYTSATNLAVRNEYTAAYMFFNDANCMQRPWPLQSDESTYGFALENDMDNTNDRL